MLDKITHIIQLMIGYGYHDFKFSTNRRSISVRNKEDGRKRETIYQTIGFKFVIDVQGEFEVDADMIEYFNSEAIKLDLVFSLNFKGEPERTDEKIMPCMVFRFFDKDFAPEPEERAYSRF
ncbi:MAG: hypothetical protein LBN95_00575 [Prevotellaceae bacterium]|jgi:hypothetical protein|nr:hypothetical protein [Prevotellaceae bacterium]